MRTVQLGELGEIVSGSTPKTTVPKYWDGDIPWVTPADLSNHEGIYFQGKPKRITKAGYESCSTTMLPPRSILFSSRAPIGHCAVTTYPVCTNQGFKSIIPNKNFDPVYGYFALKFITPTIIAKGRGATFVEINKELIEEVEVPFCDLPDQQRIAGQLEYADRLCRMRRYALELGDTLLPAAFNSIFGSEAECLKRWPVARLDDCCRRITDGTHLTPKFLSAGVPFIFVRNVDNGSIDFTTDKFISEEMHRQLYSRCPVERGDVLYTIVGATYGQAVPVGDFTKFAFQRHIAHLKPDDQIVMPKFLASVMQFPVVKTQADRWARGAAQPTINLKELKEFKIPVPPLPLQEQFAALVARHERLRTVQRESLRQAEHLFQTLLHQAFNTQK
jgi:type I restriction enzyme, S subunit